MFFSRCNHSKRLYLTFSDYCNSRCKRWWSTIFCPRLVGKKGKEKLKMAKKNLIYYLLFYVWTSNAKVTPNMSQTLPCQQLWTAPNVLPALAKSSLNLSKYFTNAPKDNRPAILFYNWVLPKRCPNLQTLHLEIMQKWQFEN